MCAPRFFAAEHKQTLRGIFSEQAPRLAVVNASNEFPRDATGSVNVEVEHDGAIRSDDFAELIDDRFPQTGIVALAQATPPIVEDCPARFAVRVTREADNVILFVTLIRTIAGRGWATSQDLD